MTDAPVSVLLVDDQSLFRAGIRMLVDSQPDLEIVAEAEDGAVGVRRAVELRPDVVLMDVRMPVMDGIQATTEILERFDRSGLPAPKIIVLTTFDLDEAAATALKRGASGFLLKDTHPEFLLAAIRTVQAGNAVIAPSATVELFRHVSGGTTTPVPEAFSTLTSREHDIFLFAAAGLSNAEIAAQEFVSEATVKTHISRVLAKLGLRDRVQLVIYAYEHGLVDPGRLHPGG